METNLWFVAAALALTESFFPLVFSFASEDSSLPSSPKLLLLAGLVTLALLLLPSAKSGSRHSSYGGITSKGGASASANGYRSVQSRPHSSMGLVEETRHQNPQHRQKKVVHCLHLGVQEVDQLTAPDSDGRCWPDQQPHFGGFLNGDYSSSRSSSSSLSLRDVHPWMLLLLSALCGTAANNISLGLLGVLPCYAFSQLALLKVVALVLISSHTSSRLQTTFSSTGTAALAVLVLSVCVGQGVFGGAPQPPSHVPEEASVLQALQTNTTEQVPPMHVVTLGMLAAILSALSTHLLALAQHAKVQPQQYQSYYQAPQQRQHQHLIMQCILGIICNTIWMLLSTGELDGFFEDMLPSCWHGVLLLGASGMLTTTMMLHSSTDQVVAKAYAYQAAVVLAAWGSGMLLEEPQGTLFAFCSLLSGAAVLLLHSSQQESHAVQLSSHSSKGAERGSSRNWQALAHSLDLHALRHMLTQAWVVFTLVLLCVTGWASMERRVGQGALVFSPASSTQTLAQAGVTLAALQASTATPLPVAALYQSTSWALAAAASSPNATSTHKSPASSTQMQQHPAAAVAGEQSSPAWTLCPALTCSRAPSCTSSDPNCCAHLQLHMMAFWDAFMHAQGMDNQYVLLYDTLKAVNDARKIPHSFGALHMGLSAQAAVVLEEPCHKKLAWKRGYAIFLQGHTWRMCAHRDHPLPVFQQHMHPVRHLALHHTDDSIAMHIMWPLTKAANQSMTQQPQQQLAKPSEARALGLVGSLLGVGQGQVATWKLCPSGAVLSTGKGNSVNINGLQLPQPIYADKELTQSFEPNRAAAVHSVAKCSKLVAELLVRVGF